MRRGSSAEAFYSGPCITGTHGIVYREKVLCYVPVDNRWYTFEECPFRVDGTPSTIYFKGGLYVLGGGLGRRVFRLTLDEALPIWKEIARLNQVSLLVPCFCFAPG